jgi:hypothetical protein
MCSVGRFSKLFKTNSSPVYGLTLLEHPRAETDVNGRDGLCVVHEFEEWHLQAAKKINKQFSPKKLKIQSCCSFLKIRN